MDLTILVLMDLSKIPFASSHGVFEEKNKKILTVQ